MAMAKAADDDDAAGADGNVERVVTPTPVDALDETFDRLRAAIEVRAEKSLTKKSNRIRVRNWMAKLCAREHARELKRNRNRHARLLLEMLRRGDDGLGRPFDAMPGDGRLGRFAREDATLYGVDVDGPFSVEAEERLMRGETMEDDEEKTAVKTTTRRSRDHPIASWSTSRSEAQGEERDAFVSRNKRAAPRIFERVDEVDVILNDVISATGLRFNSSRAAGSVDGPGASRAVGSVVAPSASHATPSRKSRSDAALRAEIEELRANVRRLEAKSARQASKIVTLKDELDAERKARSKELSHARRRREKKELDDVVASLGQQSLRSSPLKDVHHATNRGGEEFDNFIANFVAETERLRRSLAKSSAVGDRLYGVY